MCIVATFNPWVYSKRSMNDFPVQFVSAIPFWSNPVMVGVDRAGEANGAGDGTVEWSSNDDCRLQPFDKEATAGQQPERLSEQ